MKLKPYPAYRDSGVAWLGEIPAGWEVKRLRFHVRTNPPQAETSTLPDDLEVSFVPMEDIGEDGKLTLERTKTLREAKDGSYTYFRDGDIIVAKITPCFENGKGALASGLVSGIGFGTTEIAVLRASPAVDRRYLFFATLCRPFRSMGESEMYGAGGQKRVPEEFIRNLKHPIPPLAEQHSITTFLDCETARIDALVAKKERLIELLREQRAALITRAVTKGLAPTAPLKDSGVEWLGKIPAHWEVLPFTKYIVEKSDYRGKTPEKIQDGVFLVTAKNVKMGFIDYECSQEYVAEDEYDMIMRRGLPKKGDILFTTEAPLGNVAIVNREDIALAQRIIRFRMMPECFDSRYTLYAMMSDFFQGQLQILSTGSTAEGLKASKLSRLRIIGVPLHEQRAIAASLDRETARIDTLIEKTRRSIELLREKRAALITAAVTGKIDLRGVAI